MVFSLVVGIVTFSLARINGSAPAAKGKTVEFNLNLKGNGSLFLDNIVLYGFSAMIS